MSKSKKALILFLLVAVNAAVSLACGGGGGGGGGTGVTLSPSVSPSPSPSATPTPSPSPTPSTSPTPTPTPTPVYSIGDFEGSWKLILPSGKVDMQEPMDLWLLVDGSGNIIAEPAEFGFTPRVDGGTITLDDAATGAFSATVTVALSDSATETVEFTGTINEARDTLTVHFIASDTDGTFEKQPGLAGAAGKYSCVALQQKSHEDDNRFLEDVVVLDLAADGTMTFTEDPDSLPGHWLIFRERYVMVDEDMDEDDNGEIDGHLSMFVEIMREEAGVGPARPNVFGWYRAYMPEEAIEGDIMGLRLTATDFFDASFLAGTWNLVIEEEDESPTQLPGFIINADGIPPQPDSEVLGGTIDEVNGETGYFQITLQISSDEGARSTILRGHISPFRDYACATEYGEAGGKVDAEPPGYIETGEVKMIAAGAFTPADLDGYWSAGVLPVLGADAPRVMNFKVSGGLIYDSDDPDAEPLGSVFPYADNRLTFMWTIEDETGKEITFWAYGMVAAADDLFSATATGWAFEEGSDEVMLPVCYFGTYDSSETGDADLAVYEGTYSLQGGTDTIVFEAGHATTGGVTYTLAWEERNLLSFALINDTAGDYADGATMFFVPHSIAVRLGEGAFTDNESHWGTVNLAE